MYSHMQLELTIGFWVWLNAVDNVGVCHEEVGDPLVPHEHPPTVAAAHHPVLTLKVGLLDLCVCVCVCECVCVCVCVSTCMYSVCVCEYKYVCV